FAKRLLRSDGGDDGAGALAHRTCLASAVSAPRRSSWDCATRYGKACRCRSAARQSGETYANGAKTGTRRPFGPGHNNPGSRDPARDLSENVILPLTFPQWKVQTTESA